jgi:hypothetical protein
MNRVIRIIFVVGIVVVVWASAVKVGEALNLSRQRKTMAVMLALASRVDMGHRPRAVPDAWGTPMRFQFGGKRYLIRSAGSDHRFESTPPHGEISSFAADIVLASDGFLQYPAGF